jgi:hypothetical protein
MNLVRATIANLGTDPFKKKLEEIKVKFKQQA